MRIALTTPFCWPEVRRGGERYVHELAAALHDAGHDVTIWSSAPEASQDRIMGVDVIRLKRRSVARSRFGEQSEEIGFGLQLLARLGREPIDVWHANGISDAAAAVVTAKVRPRLRTVFTDHGFPVAASKAKRRDAGLHRRVVRGVGRYVCVSQAAGDWLVKDFRRAPVVLSPGVDLRRFTPGSRDLRPTLLFCGKLDEPRKHLPLLLEAAAILLPTWPDLQLWLVGPGDASPALSATTPSVREAVTRCGPADDDELVAAYASAWTTALPSVAESFGLVVIESLAAGTPVVVRRDSGAPAGLISSPAIGRVSGPTADELAGSISECLELAGDPSTREACRAEAESYDWRRVVAPRIEAIYG